MLSVKIRVSWYLGILVRRMSIRATNDLDFSNRYRKKINQNIRPKILLTSYQNIRHHINKRRNINTMDSYSCSVSWLNLLKSNGYVMHHQFNIQQLYALPTLYLCVLYLSENKQRLVLLTA